jgi:hypothetical protein
MVKKVRFYEAIDNEGTFRIAEGMHNLALKLDGRRMSLDKAVGMLENEAAKHDGEVKVLGDRSCIAYHEGHTGYLLIKYQQS